MEMNTSKEIISLLATRIANLEIELAMLSVQNKQLMQEKEEESHE